MPISQFVKYLILAILSSIAIFFFFKLFIPLGPYMEFLFWSLGFFILLSVMAYVMAYLSIKLKDGAPFLMLIVGNVFLKIIGSFLFVAIYAKYNTPKDRYFLVPFLITYLIFTIFETYFLSLQARDTK